MTLNDEQKTLISNFFNYENGDGQLRKNYSGRCMHGNNCIGIVSSNPTAVLIDLVIYLMNNDEDQLAEKFKGMRSDNMGRDQILYFPSIQWGEEVEDMEDMEDMEDVEAEECQG